MSFSLHVKENLQLPMTNRLLAKVQLLPSIITYFYSGSLNCCPYAHPNATFVNLFSSLKYSWKILFTWCLATINQLINQSLSGNIFIPILNLSNHFPKWIYFAMPQDFVNVVSLNCLSPVLNFIGCYKLHVL